MSRNSRFSRDWRNLPRLWRLLPQRGGARRLNQASYTACETGAPAYASYLQAP